MQRSRKARPRSRPPRRPRRMRARTASGAPAAPAPPAAAGDAGGDRRAAAAPRRRAARHRADRRAARRRARSNAWRKWLHDGFIPGRRSQCRDVHRSAVRRCGRSPRAAATLRPHRAPAGTCRHRRTRVQRPIAGVRSELPPRPDDLRRPLRQQRLAAGTAQAGHQADVGQRRADRARAPPSGSTSRTATSSRCSTKAGGCACRCGSIPGHAQDAITITLGYGRTRAGRVGNAHRLQRLRAARQRRRRGSARPRSRRPATATSW